jgi:hypothetical protein
LGQHLNYTFRNYDSWIIRFGAIDPLAAKYPHNSTYAFSENRVIDAVELEGLEAFFLNDGSFDHWGSDKSKTAPVIVIANAGDTEGQTLSLNVNDFMNRVHWQFGETGGTSLKGLAHAINNSSKQLGETGMYKKMTTRPSGGETITAETQIAIYLDQTTTDIREKVNPEYITFKKLFRTNLDYLTNLSIGSEQKFYKKAGDYKYSTPKQRESALNNFWAIKDTKKIIAATINVLLFESDILEGAGDWAGASLGPKGNYDTILNYVEKVYQPNTTVFGEGLARSSGYKAFTFFYKRDNTHKPIKTNVKNIE